MKIDQIAFYCKTDNEERQVKEHFGLSDAEWIKDNVVSSSIIGGKEYANTASLQFNYDLGIELEILRYTCGLNWHINNPGKGVTHPFISHVGIHLGDGEPFPDEAGRFIFKLVQETFTQSHTAEYLTTGPGAGRLYHYKIYEMAPGHYVKYIRRIHPWMKSKEGTEQAQDLQHTYLRG